MTLLHKALDIFLIGIMLAGTLVALGNVVAANPSAELRKHFEKQSSYVDTAGWRMWKLMILAFWVIALWRFVTK